MPIRPSPALSLAGFSLALTLNLAAQTDTRRDSVYRAMLDFPALVEGGGIEPPWMADRRSFWYLENRADSAVALRVNPATGEVTPLLDVARTRSALRRALGYEPPHHGLPFPAFELTPDEGGALFELEGRRWRLELATYQARSLGPAAAAAPARRGEAPSPDGRWFARAEAGNLWLRSPVDDRSIQLTTDGVDRFGWGGLLPGSIDWSPTGTHLMASKSDERRVHHIPVVHWLKPEEEQIEWSPYQHAGSAVAATELYVIDVARRQVTRLDTGDEPERQLRSAGWRKDGGEAYLIRTDRLMTRVDLLAADPRSGKTRLLVTERQPTFVEGLALTPSNLLTPFTDGSRFVWRSERDGWSHLYLYQGDGTLVRRLTQGTFPVDNVVAIDEKRGWVYLMARDDRARPYDLHLYRVDLGGGRFTRLTEGRGEHGIQMSPDFEFFVDTYSTVDRPPVVELRRADGTKVRDLGRADIARLTALGWKTPEEFMVKAADGTTDLYGSLYRPFDFDPAKRYPVIDLQYMGNFMHAAPRRFHQTWLGDEAQALTQLGFIVFIVDGRGTTGRGKAFQDHTYHAIGKSEVSDQVAALRQLAASRPWMDTTRVGITGYSWGGYYTLRAMLTAPDVFKVGVAGAPVVDLLAHTSPIEAYMGLPQDNRDGYAQASNVTLADRLQGKLLITIGTADVNVTFNHTMRLADAFIKAGKHFDLLVLPGETHGLTPAALAYYKEARARYFVEHLQPHNKNSTAIDRGNKGYPATSPDTIRALIKRYHDAGFHVSVHSIGDRAIDWTVDSYLDALTANPIKGRRHGIIHANIPTDRAIDLIAKLQREYDAGYPESSPAFTWWIGDTYAGNFGPARSARLNPFRTFEKKGIRWAGSSDYNVTPPCPLWDLGRSGPRALVGRLWQGGLWSSGGRRCQDRPAGFHD